MKQVKAVAPYIHKHFVNFKSAPYEAWVKLGGQVAPAHYPPRWLHGVVFRCELPRWIKSLCWSGIFNSQFSIFNFRDSARLRFVEPVSLYFDAFPDYALYEVIPFFWDVWPQDFEKVCKWLKRHEVKTAFFTSSQTVAKIKARFPKMNVIWCPEAIDTEVYKAGKPLKVRRYDYLEYGRCSRAIDSSTFEGGLSILSNGNGEILNTRGKLIDALADSRINMCLTRLDTNPEEAGDIDTLTQRYWECMLSGCIVIGRAPKELVDMIGYNPVIDLHLEKCHSQNEKNQRTYHKIQEILSDIELYQELVDKNRKMALKHGDWSVRMKFVMEQLASLGYKI